MGRRVIGLALLYALIVVMAPSDADGRVSGGAPSNYSVARPGTNTPNADPFPPALMHAVAVCG